MQERLTELSIHRPKTVISFWVLFALVAATGLSRLKIDTDPENMLSENESVRIIHNELK